MANAAETASERLGRIAAMYAAMTADFAAASAALKTDPARHARTLAAAYAAFSAGYAAASAAADQAEAMHPFPLLPLNAAAVAAFDRFLADKKARKVERDDLLMASICIAHSATLVTRNVKDFKPLPGLRIENWAD